MEIDARVLRANWLPPPPPPPPPPRVRSMTLKDEYRVPLTQREHQVILLIGEGLKNHKLLIDWL